MIAEWGFLQCGVEFIFLEGTKLEASNLYFVRKQNSLQCPLLRQLDLWESLAGHRKGCRAGSLPLTPLGLW